MPKLAWTNVRVKCSRRWHAVTVPRRGASVDVGAAPAYVQHPLPRRVFAAGAFDIAAGATVLVQLKSGKGWGVARGENDGTVRQYHRQVASTRVVAPSRCLTRCKFIRWFRRWLESLTFAASALCIVQLAPGKWWGVERSQNDGKARQYHQPRRPNIFQDSVAGDATVVVNYYYFPYQTCFR
jgi:hypothetical protein